MEKFKKYHTDNNVLQLESCPNSLFTKTEKNHFKLIVCFFLILNLKVMWGVFVSFLITKRYRLHGQKLSKVTLPMKVVKNKNNKSRTNVSLLREVCRRNREDFMSPSFVWKAMTKPCLKVLSNKKSQRKGFIGI